MVLFYNEICIIKRCPVRVSLPRGMVIFSTAFGIGFLSGGFYGVYTWS